MLMFLTTSLSIFCIYIVIEDAKRYKVLESELELKEEVIEQLEGTIIDLKEDICILEDRVFDLEEQGGLYNE